MGNSQSEERGFALESQKVITLIQNSPLYSKVCRWVAY